MVIFSIVMLVLILFGIQHLLNWFWRKNYKYESMFGLAMILTFIGFLISYGLIYLIILWGKNLM